jgi:hypothetical protein
MQSHGRISRWPALNGGQDKNSLRDALPAVAVIGGT